MGFLPLPDSDGMARFRIEMIRINPRSFFGMSNAQAASVASILLGVMLLFVLPRKTLPQPAAK